MKTNFWKFVIPFVIFAVLMFVLTATFPFNWGFCGIGLPAIFGGACLFCQFGAGANAKDREWIYAGFGAALGGAFALYVLPHFFIG